MVTATKNNSLALILVRTTPTSIQINCAAKTRIQSRSNCPRIFKKLATKFHLYNKGFISLVYFLILSNKHFHIENKIARCTTRPLFFSLRQFDQA